MKLFLWCIPLRKARRRSKDVGFESPCSSAASDDMKATMPPFEFGEGSQFTSLLVQPPSDAISGAVSPHQPDAGDGRRSIADSNRSLRISDCNSLNGSGSLYTDRQSNNSQFTEMDLRAALRLIRRLSRALNATTEELQKTEAELKEVIIELAELKGPTRNLRNVKTCDDKTNRRRRGSCPVPTVASHALPLPAGTLFSVIHPVVRQDSC
jgi:hypothetical protein